MALTDAKLRSLKATGKVQKFADGGGLHVRRKDSCSLVAVRSVRRQEISGVARRQRARLTTGATMCEG